MKRLEDFFFAPLRFRGLYVMRAAFGLMALWYYLRLSPYLQVFFGPAGVGGFDTAQRWPTFPIAATEGFEHFELLRHISQPGVVVVLYVALLLAALLFAVGCFTRVAGLSLAVLHVIFAAHQPHLTMGWAQIYPAFVVYVSLAPCGRFWSVDVWLRRRRGPVPSAPAAFAAWPLRLVQLHVIAIYLTAGWPRFTSQAWLHGETVLHAVADTRFGRWGTEWHGLQPLLAVATYYALAIEPAAVFFLPLRATRRWYALGLIALHLGIELVADVGMWQFMMVTALCAFLPDAWFRRLPGLHDQGAAESSIA